MTDDWTNNGAETAGAAIGARAERSPVQLFLLVGGVAMFPIACLLFVLCVPALARDNGQYSQVAPEIRQWFRDQKSPKTGGNCCNEADGNEAQEDIRDGHYWTTWPGVAPTWYQVPDEVVIKEPNKIGRPVVWFYYDSGQVKIRCFAPGGGV